MKEDTQLVGITHLVKAFHLKERQIRYLILDRVLPKAVDSQGRQPLYDYWLMHHAFIDYMSGKGGLSSIAKKKEEHLEKRIRKLDMDDAIAKGVLVEKKEVEKQAFDSARKVRDAMLNIPDRISSILATEKKETKVRKLLIAEIKNALVDINPYAK